MSTEILGGTIEEEVKSIIIPPESFQEAVNDRMNKRIIRDHSPQSMTIKDFIAAPLILGGVFAITIGIPLAAVVEIVNNDFGTANASTIILTSAVGGALYGLYNEIRLRISK